VIPNGKDDQNWQVIVISETGYVHRFPLAGIALKGRATMGVRCLRISKASGKLATVAVGLEKNNVDVYLADWRRQRIPIASMALASRDVQGDRLVKDKKKVPVAAAVVL
jgi:DNA gyrase/topoisomerase IV subunit A